MEEKQFVALFNSLASTRYTTANKILKLRSSDVAQTIEFNDCVNITFNLLAVSEGLREVALLGPVPKDWQLPDVGLNLHFQAWSYPGTVMFANSNTMSKDDIIKLTNSYTGNDAKVNAELGHRMGYLYTFPPPRPGKADGSIHMNLYLPNTPFDCRADKRYRIVSEYGPQSIVIDKVPDVLKRGP